MAADRLLQLGQKRKSLALLFDLMSETGDRIIQS